MQPQNNNPSAKPVRPVGVTGAAGAARPVRPVGSARPVRRPVAIGGVSGANVAPMPAAEPEPTFDNGPSVVGKKERKTGWILAIVLLLLIAAGGVGFGVWMWMDGNAQKEALNNQISDLQQANNNLTVQLDNTSGAINVDVDGNEVDTSDYIYVGEWGIKIKIPDDLQIDSYEVDSWDSDKSAGMSLCVSGATSGHDGVEPTFLSGTPENRYTDILKVCLRKNEKSTSEEDGGFMYDTMPVGQFYIVGPQAILGDGTDSDWEVESADALKLMLEDESNRLVI